MLRKKFAGTFTGQAQARRGRRGRRPGPLRKTTATRAPRRAEGSFSPTRRSLEGGRCCLCFDFGARGPMCIVNFELD